MIVTLGAMRAVLSYVLVVLAFARVCVGQTAPGTIDLTDVARVGESERLTWEALPEVPDELGLAGAFAGVHEKRSSFQGTTEEIA